MKTHKVENFSHYIIERSADAKNYSSLKTIKASGSYSSVEKYSAYDDSPLAGVNYYRLKMVDADGNFKYSDVIKVNFSVARGVAGCFPNPAINYVNVVLANADAGTYDYSVSTLQGNVVKASSATLNSGAQQVKIDLAGNIPPGVLIIRMHNRQTSNTEVFRVVKG